MSFGSQTGRTRSGTKGFSSKEKKLKRKKQDFHIHRRGHSQESERPNPSDVRARTLIVLDRLGHQVLSTETGGYDLEDWIRNLDSLLDDFQEKLGDDLVGAGFRARWEEAVASLTTPSATGGIDSEIEKLTQEEALARETISDLEKKAAATLASLREERDVTANELKLERKKLADLKEAKQSRKFFSRMLNSGPSTDEAEMRVAELAHKHTRLEEDIERSRKARSAPAEGDPAYVEARQRLEDVRGKLVEMQSARQGSLQLTQEREIATKKIAEMISTMKLDEAASSEGGTEAQ